MASHLIKGLAFISLLGLAGGPTMANEPVAAPAPETAQKPAAPGHKTHEKHKHEHGSKKCKHKSEQHGNHTDYEHDGHHHNSHEGHVDECDNQHS